MSSPPKKHQNNNTMQLPMSQDHTRCPAALSVVNITSGTDMGHRNEELCLVLSVGNEFENSAIFSDAEPPAAFGVSLHLFDVESLGRIGRFGEFLKRGEDLSRPLHGEFAQRLLDATMVF